MRRIRFSRRQPSPHQAVPRLEILERIEHICSTNVGVECAVRLNPIQFITCLESVGANVVGHGVQIGTDGEAAVQAGEAQQLRDREAGSGQAQDDAEPSGAALRAYWVRTAPTLPTSSKKR